MFKFFTKRWVSRKDYEWVSRKDYEEKVKELVFEVQEKHQIWEKYFKKEGELLEIINEKEKTIQRLELKLMDDGEREAAELNCTLGKSKEKGQGEDWVIPFCLNELRKMNKRLMELSNPEMQEMTMRSVIFMLSSEMQMQNNIMAQSLLALNLQKPVNIEDNA
jgi:hypothetical protein